MKIGMGSSEGGAYLAGKVKEYLQKSGYDISDYTDENNDIFNISCDISNAVINGEIDKGIVIDDYGTVPFMVCSKHKGIVCAQ